VREGEAMVMTADLISRARRPEMVDAFRELIQAVSGES